MNTILKYLFIALLSYILGSLNSSIILSKLIFKKDIRNYGSGNGGLTNSYRTMGGKVTIVVLLWDFAKGFISCLIGGYFFGLTGKLVAGIFVLMGHIFPVFFKFKGGKGVLTGAALALVVDWRVFLIVIAIFIILVAITRYVSLGSVVATATFAIIMPFFCRERTTLDIILAIAIVVSIIVKHHANIARLISGTESKFSFRKNPKVQITKE